MEIEIGIERRTEMEIRIDIKIYIMMLPQRLSL